jgi:hypothetical protein
MVAIGIKPDQRHYCPAEPDYFRNIMESPKQHYSSDHGRLP